MVHHFIHCLSFFVHLQQSSNHHLSNLITILLLQQAFLLTNETSVLETETQNSHD